MRVCLLTDCDCNKTGYCTDNYATTTYAFVTSASRCQSYNPKEEDDDENSVD